ncbi:MAG: TonB-dependent receptor [Steroidobacteraceae bacterium]
MAFPRALRFLASLTIRPLLLAAAALGVAYPRVTLAQQSPQAVPASGALSEVKVQASRITQISPGVSNDYQLTSENIADLPAGDDTVLTDVLAQMPGVGIDQNQQVHIRNTEGSGFQYEINGALVPLDITTNPPFMAMFNPLFIKRLDLLDGVLPAQYSYSMGGVIDIETKDGCEQPGGNATIYAGQREMFQPSVQYGGCDGALSYYGSALYTQSNLAFSSATPGPTPIHDWTHQVQALGVLTYSVSSATRLSLIVSAAPSTNQLPNVSGLTPQFPLANAPVIPSADINSYLNFKDYLAILSLTSSPTSQLSYELSYTAHDIEELYQPDDVGELEYQGIATQASHNDLDNTLQGDLKYRVGAHTVGAGFYVGAYHVSADGSSLVFPADASGTQISDVPFTVINDLHQMNILTGLYVDDLWTIDRQLRLSSGVRWDTLSGISHGNQVNPTLNLSYTPVLGTTFHVGAARYFQVPSFEGISPNAPAAFANSTGAGPVGVTTPLPEEDWEYDVGLVQVLTPHMTMSEDNFYEKTRHYLDAGQFGAVPVFAPFNYQHGYIWGSEVAVDYSAGRFSAYGNATLGRNLETGVATGEFNFADPAELADIDSHYIVLDHQPITTVNAGAAYGWRRFKFSVDAVYDTGLRTGFANQLTLPHVFQVNLGAQTTFEIAGHQLSNRLTLLNIFDRVNLIRPFGGLGVFQTAYGPRFTAFDALTLYF